MITRHLAALFAVGALAGCASNPVFEGGRAWSDGWRDGMIEKVGTASELGGWHTYDCRKLDTSSGRDGSGRFVVVAVQNMSKHQHVVVPMEPAKELQIGVRALVNLRGCEPPIARSAQ